MGNIIGFVVVFFLFGSIPTIIFFLLYSRHKEKMAMLNRGANPAQLTSPPSPQTGNTSLMLGLLAIFLGISFAVSAVLVQQHFDRDLMTGGVIFIFVGAAFMSYWKLTAGDRDRARRIQEEHYKWLLTQTAFDAAKHTTGATPGE